MASQFETNTSTISAEEAAVPVKLVIEYPERLSRLLIFVKWLFAIPLFIFFFTFGVLQ
ncbi:hypothetical protein ACFLTP_08330 [Chloroflexota bacterium]